MPRKTELSRRRVPGSAQLPEFYAITAPLRVVNDQPIVEQQSFDCWIERFTRLANSGISLIQIRAKELGREHLSALVGACVSVPRPADVRLLLNGPADIAMSHELDGIHLTSRHLQAATARPVPEGMLLGASCHSPAELRQAQAIGADFACLSPLKPVEKYGTDECLGFERFGRWARDCDIPVYGLGGLTEKDLKRIVQVGGHGVAGISAFW